jgi:lambda family phage portal protein
MNILDPILKRVGYIPRSEFDSFRTETEDRLKQLSHKREYAAAAVNRLTADWISSRTAIDADVRRGLIPIRERARDLVKNNDYAKAFIRNLRINVVGPHGFTLQMNVRKSDGKPDKDANKRISDAWQEWTDRLLCSVDGQHSLRGLCDQLIQYIGRDGEGMLRIVNMSGEKYGMQLQVIEPELLDELKSIRIDANTFIKMGVQMNIWRRPLAYHLRVIDPIFDLYGATPLSPNEHSVVSSRELLHGFDREYSNQTRGISWLVQTMFRLKMLTGYEEAAVINARVGASKMGFFRDPIDHDAKFTGTDADADGNTVVTAAPGTFEDIGPKEFVAWDPKYPDQAHEQFMMSMLKGAASGLGQAYMSIAGDLSQANYSSMRAGLLPERDNYTMIQTWFAETFLYPVFRYWLENALMRGELDMPKRKFQMSQFDQLNKPAFIGRKWDWIDPEKDVNAKIKSRAAGFASPFDIAGEQGKSLEAIYDDIKEAEDLAKEKGIVLQLDTQKVAFNQPETGIDQTASDTTATQAQNAAKALDLLAQARALLKPQNGHKVTA